MRDGKPRYITVTATEKVGRGIRLIARGSSGHGSVPRPDNAIAHLAQAVARAAAWQPPMRLSDITRTYFERLATISSPEEARRYNGILIPAKAPEIESYFRERELNHNSVLRTSISPSIIKGGFRGNVIPSEAEAYLDIRAMPDEDMGRFYDSLRKVIDDSSVELAASSRPRPAPPSSRLDTEMFRVLEQAQHRVYPGPSLFPRCSPVGPTWERCAPTASKLTASARWPRRSTRWRTGRTPTMSGSEKRRCISSSSSCGKL